jgi:hypothetical protein
MPNKNKKFYIEKDLTPEQVEQIKIEKRTEVFRIPILLRIEMMEFIKNNKHKYKDKSDFIEKAIIRLLEEEKEKKA